MGEGLQPENNASSMRDLKSKVQQWLQYLPALDHRLETTSILSWNVRTLASILSNHHSNVQSTRTCPIDYGRHQNAFPCIRPHEVWLPMRPGTSNPYGSPLRVPLTSSKEHPKRLCLHEWVLLSRICRCWGYLRSESSWIRRNTIGTLTGSKRHERLPCQILDGLALCPKFVYS